MKVTVTEERIIKLTKIYNSILLETADKEQIYICMRDSGFEFTYEGKAYMAQKGKISKVETRITPNNKVDKTDPI